MKNLSYLLRNSITPGYLFLCLVLGGASAAGFTANLLLQLLAIPIIAWAVLSRRSAPLPRATQQLLAIAALICAIAVIQLIPLPPELWSSMPGREAVVRGMTALEMELPWLPISLAPYQTVASVMWLLPAAAILLGICKLGHFSAAGIAWCASAVAVASVIVGALQIFGGDQSQWYFYKVTNRGSTTGFFSNANHMATLLLMTLPLVGALAAKGLTTRGSLQRASGMLVLSIGFGAVAVIGLAINSSLAGIGLAAPVIVATGLMIVTRKRKLPLWSLLLVLVVAAAALTAALSAPFENNLTLSSGKDQSVSRQTTFTTGYAAAQDYLPFGSGIGTFNYIYPMYENPDAVTRVYINHVHNDYIEVLLESGVFGLAALLLFFLWWLTRSITIWSSDSDFYAKAATIATAAVLAHSFVDYPLRTAAISALFAACCALMAEPRPRGQAVERKKTGRAAKHLTA